jgi:hypothetical protein
MRTETSSSALSPQHWGGRRQDPLAPQDKGRGPARSQAGRPSRHYQVRRTRYEILTPLSLGIFTGKASV